MDAYDRSSAIEHATMTRVVEIYAGALRQALKNKKTFLQKVKDVDTGKIKPPQYYIDTDQVDKWKQGFLRELIRQNAVIDDIVKELNKAGVEAAELIRGSMVDIYQANREEAVSAISKASKGMAVQASFSTYNKKQIDALVEEGQSPFSKLAYQNMGQNPVIRRRLQNELGMAAILGESQAKLIKRIQKVTGQTVAQARRVAQTERTRVQSQARWQTGQEAAAMGLPIVNEWSTRMVNSRDSHAALDGQKEPQGEPFHTIWGNDLLYPGDPSAPAREVINCHCVLVPDVVFEESIVAEEPQEKPFDWIEDARTQDDIVMAMENQGWFRTKAKYSATLDDCDMESAIAVYRGYEKFFERYPQMRGKFNPVVCENLNREGRYAVASLLGGGISVNSQKFWNYSGLVRSYETDLKANFHPKGTNVFALVTHECGHGLDGYLTFVKKTKNYFSQSFRASVLKACKKKQSDVASGVSIYASKDHYEFFAECLAEGLWSDNPGEIATEFMRQLDEVMTEVK